MKRGDDVRRFSLFFLLFTLSILLFSSLCSLVAGETGGSLYTLIPEQLHAVPGTILLVYNNPVTITGGELYTADGVKVAEYSADDFTMLDATNYTVTTPEAIPPGSYKLVVGKQEALPPHNPLSSDIIMFDYMPLADSIQLLPVEENINILQPTSAGESPTGEPFFTTLFAQQSPYNLTFNTTKPGWCKYSMYEGVSDPSFMSSFDLTGSPSSPVTTHKITSLTAREISQLTVYCTDGSESVTRWFTAGFEDEEPTFTVSFDPPIIVDPVNPVTNISIVTNPPQMVFCNATGSGGGASSGEHYNPPLHSDEAGAYEYNPWMTLSLGYTPVTRTNERFTVRCTNRAGLSSVKEVTVVVDPTITPSLIMLSPSRYTKNNHVILKVEAARDNFPLESSLCVFTSSVSSTFTPGDDNIVWTADLGVLEDGDYSYTVRCVIAGGIPVEENFTVTVDTTPPPTPSLFVPEYTCGGTLFAELNLSSHEVPDPNFNGYLYNVTYATGGVVLASGHEAGGENARIELALDTEVNETYHWHIWPVDLAGNKGQELTGSTLVLEEGNPLCDYTPPTIWLEQNKTPISTIVTVLCEDSESGCQDAFWYDQLGPNASSTECAYASTETLGRNLTFYENGTLCFKVKDKNNNEATGFSAVGVENASSIPPPEEHCTNGLFDEGLESDVDCGGSCSPCEGNASCSVGSDCVSGYCNADNVCENVSCTDGIQNGYETGVDCGGSCVACSLGESCDANSDCESGYCLNQTCAEKPAPAKECTTNSDCASGKECRDDYCVNVENESNNVENESKKGVETECVDDLDCSEDEECVSGTCFPREKSSLLGLLLIVLGAIIMAGSGYWLYTLHEERKEEVVQAPPVYTSPATTPGLSPPQRLALQQQRAQLAARAALAKQRLAEKAAKRRAALESFGGEPGDGKSESRQKGLGGEKVERVTAKRDETGVAEESEEFIDIRDLGKKKTVAKKPDSSAEPDTDDILTPKEDPFKELDEVLGQNRPKEPSKNVNQQKTNQQKANQQRG